MAGGAAEVSIARGIDSHAVMVAGLQLHRQATGALASPLSASPFPRGRILGPTARPGEAFAHVLVKGDGDFGETGIYIGGAIGRFGEENLRSFLPTRSRRHANGLSFERVDVLG